MLIQEKEGDDASTESKTLDKPETPKSQDNQETETALDTINNQQDTKGTVDTDMLLNDNVPTESEIADQEEETENTVQEDITVKVEREAPVQEEDTVEEADLAKEEEETAQAQEEPMQVDQVILDNVEKGDDEIADAGENKTGDLDIESMLAAIHNDNPPPTEEETQN